MAGVERRIWNRDTGYGMVNFIKKLAKKLIKT